MVIIINKISKYGFMDCYELPNQKMSSLVNKITISPEEKNSFTENGFVKLKKLFTDETIDKLRNLIAQSHQVKRVSESYSGDFSRVGYDLENGVTKKIYFHENFKDTLKQLIEN
ncbi:MAG: hypothetical protein F6K09_30800, partial [Merismopedia sp. SIO2A8]|nr:hypothetical protein [Merismopedia sp. SIO2A8]